MKRDSFHKFAKLCKKLKSISSNIYLRKELKKYLRKVPKSSIKYTPYFLLGNINPRFEYKYIARITLRKPKSWH